MPAAVRIVESESVFPFLAKPKRLMQTNFHSIKPRISWCFVGEEEDNIDFFEGAECGFGVEEVYERDYGEVCRCEDNPGAVANVGERYGGDEHDAGRC